MQQIAVPAAILAAALLATQYPRIKQLVTNRRGRSTYPARSPSPATEEKGTRYGPSTGNEKIQEPDPLWGLTPDKVQDYDDRPWRPFRWPYHQTMSIFRLDINHWLDMDKFYIEYLNEKARIFQEHGTDHCDWIPGESDEACQELLDTVVNHMLTRYPRLFKKTEKGIHNLVTDEDIDLRQPLKQHPLVNIAKLAKEDFYIVQQRDDGKHYMVAAAVPFPGGSFKISDKLGKYIDLIHEEVPYYDEKLKPSMERWFSKLKPHEPVERASWYITWDHPSEAPEMMCSRVYADEIPKDVPYKKFTVRVERQTLRRLPKSKAIIFTNHPVYYNVEEMKDEPGVPSIIKKIILEGPEKIQQYKNFGNFQDIILPYLDQLIQRQLDLGIIDRNHVVKTSPTYPFAHWVKQPFGEHGWTNPIFREVDLENRPLDPNSEGTKCPVAH